jgi:phage baseplate assembly protein W
MIISQNNKQIQPKWPLQIDSQTGPYTSVSSVAASLKQDFVFLLQTIPGEWPMNPDLGIGLATYLFENYESLELTNIRSNIDTQLKKYLSNIKLIDAKFINTDDNQDDSISTLQISYFIEDLGIQDEINFGLNNVTRTMVDVESLG